MVYLSRLNWDRSILSSGAVIKSTSVPFLSDRKPAAAGHPECHESETGI
jgi:hypothetical protein